ncbi:MAG TPA: RsmD family RNA methyltransferase [Candidatus Didemnitutus sp.]|nr:RsmD family RNA methyltransferase [Candidatus Didemnitutus sp.]
MRITGGNARGIPLHLPKGDAVRPATDALRQAVFSSLGARVSGARFLDLFAGSGAYGLEALSRGASGGVFVEKDSRTASFIERNLGEVCRSLGRNRAGVEVSTMDSLSVPQATIAMADLIFIDPPYAIIGEVAPRVFASIATAWKAQPDGIVIFEMPGETELAPDGWTCVKRLGKGARQPTVCFFRPVSNSVPPADSAR